MKLIPSLTTVSASATQPGELIRYYREGQPLALVVNRDSDGTNIMTFGLPAKYISIKTRDDDFVLSYGGDFSFHIPETARFIKYSTTGFGAVGAIVVDEDRAFIRLKTDEAELFYEISTGELLKVELKGGARWDCLDWQIRLNSQPTHSPPLFTFNVP